MINLSKWLSETWISQAVQNTEWVVPTTQSIHIVLIGLIAASVFMVAARILGWISTDQPISGVSRRYLPWIWGAAVGLLLTGIILVLSEPARELLSLSFWVKMSLLLVGLLSTFFFQISIERNPEYWAAGSICSPGIKLAAIGMLLLWLGIIFLGRAIAYDIIVWGALSPQYSP